MHLTRSYIYLFGPQDGTSILGKLEIAARTCYQSENLVCDGSAAKMVRMLIERGHEGILEHASLSFRVITDRATANEIVRHRIASYAQESTRYVNYDKRGMTFIIPQFLPQVPEGEFSSAEISERLKTLWSTDPREAAFWDCIQHAERCYRSLVTGGAKPEEARAILPLCLKTEVFTTMNLRSIRHFLKMRLDPAAHPDIRNIAGILWGHVIQLLPEVFQDIQ